MMNGFEFDVNCEGKLHRKIIFPVLKLTAD